MVPLVGDVCEHVQQNSKMERVECGMLCTTGAEDFVVASFWGRVYAMLFAGGLLQCFLAWHSNPFSILRPFKISDNVYNAAHVLHLDSWLQQSDIHVIGSVVMHDTHVISVILLDSGSFAAFTFRKHSLGRLDKVFCLGQMYLSRWVSNALFDEMNSLRCQQGAVVALIKSIVQCWMDLDPRWASSLTHSQPSVKAKDQDVDVLHSQEPLRLFHLESSMNLVGNWEGRLKTSLCLDVRLEEPVTCSLCLAIFVGSLRWNCFVEQFYHSPFLGGHVVTCCQEPFFLGMLSLHQISWK